MFMEEGDVREHDGYGLSPDVPANAKQPEMCVCGLASLVGNSVIQKVKFIDNEADLGGQGHQCGRHCSWYPGWIAVSVTVKEGHAGMLELMLWALILTKCVLLL